MKFKKIFSTVLGIACGLSFSVQPVWADEAELMDLIQDLQKNMAAMQRTIDQQNGKIRQLESRAPQTTAPAPAGEMAAAPMSDAEYNMRLESALGGANKWLKDVKFNADFRLRYEAFDYTNGTTAETDPVNRFRFRLRFGFEKKFSEDLKVGFALASAGLTDPTSTNTTLDGNFVYKNVAIEKAYAIYSPPFLEVGPIKNAEIGAGKVNNPFEKGSSDMIWDRDVKPEGVYEKLDFDLLNTDSLDLRAYLLGGQFILDEDATLGSQTAGGDAELFAVQAGVNPTFYVPFLERPVDWLTAGSFYNYADYARQSNFGALARGNTNVTGSATELDAEAFKVLEWYNELGITPGGFPIRFFQDFAVNTNDGAGNGSVVGENKAWAVGVKLNSIVEKGDWELSYAYKYIDPNSVVGAFNDSDFGDGHSGKRGSVFKAGYALTDNLSLNAAAIFANNVTAGTAGVLDQEQRRFQVDLQYKF